MFGRVFKVVKDWNFVFFLFTTSKRDGEGGNRVQSGDIGDNTHHPPALVSVNPNLESRSTDTRMPIIPNPCGDNTWPRTTDTRLEKNIYKRRTRLFQLTDGRTRRDVHAGDVVFVRVFLLSRARRRGVQCATRDQRTFMRRVFKYGTRPQWTVSRNDVNVRARDGYYCLLTLVYSGVRNGVETLWKLILFTYGKKWSRRMKTLVKSTEEGTGS